MVALSVVEVAAPVVEVWAGCARLETRCRVAQRLTRFRGSRKRSHLNDQVVPDWSVLR